MVQIDVGWLITAINEDKVWEANSDTVFEFTLKDAKAEPFEIRDSKDELVPTGVRVTSAEHTKWTQHRCQRIEQPAKPSATPKNPAASFSSSARNRAARPHKSAVIGSTDGSHRDSVR